MWLDGDRCGAAAVANVHKKNFGLSQKNLCVTLHYILLLFAHTLHSLDCCSRGPCVYKYYTMNIVYADQRPFFLSILDFLTAEAVTTSETCNKYMYVHKK